MRELIDAVLTPLTRARGGAEPLLRTLEAYFAAGGNASLSARSLHLSVRALTYRLDKIGRLTGPRSGRPRAALRAADRRHRRPVAGLARPRRSSLPSIGNTSDRERQLRCCRGSAAKSSARWRSRRGTRRTSSFLLPIGDTRDSSAVGLGRVRRRGPDHAGHRPARPPRRARHQVQGSGDLERRLGRPVADLRRRHLLHPGRRPGRRLHHRVAAGEITERRQPVRLRADLRLLQGPA